MMMNGDTALTAFTKTNFEYHGGYLHYTTAAGERKFVARFKHRGPVTKAKFQAALIKYYTPDTYFARLGGAYNPKGETPFGILMTDGLLTFHYGENGARNYFVLDGKAI